MTRVLQGSASRSDRYILEGATEDELALAATHFLHRLGFVVEMPGNWESPKEFCNRLGISKSHFKRRMKRSKYMPMVEMERGPEGRLVRLRSNPVFERWMRPACGSRST